MKKAFITALAFVLLLFAACNQDSDSSTGSVRIIIETTSRTIAPEDYDLDVSIYHVTGTGPDNDSFDVTTSRTAISLDGLTNGDWTIYGEGLNSDEDVLVTGSTDFTLSASNTSVTLTLDELVGEGTLSLSFSWTPDDLTDPDEAELTLTLTDQADGTVNTLTPVMNTTKGTATYSGTWPSGSYVLSAKLSCNGVLIAGIVEAVRITDGETSEGSVTFILDGTVESGTLSLTNSTGSPVELTITGLSDTVTANTEITVSLISDDDDVSDFDIYWYLDGDDLGEGEEVAFSPLIGNHILSAVASSSLIGSTGSASVSFEAIAEGEYGTPVQSIILDTDTGLNLGSDCFIKFLSDGRLMIVSNSSSTIQLATLVKSSVSIDKTVSYSTLGIDGDVTAFDVGADSSSLYIVAIGEDSPFTAKVYSFIPASNTFSLLDESDSFSLTNSINSEAVTGDADYAVMAMVYPEHDEVMFVLTGEDGELCNLVHYDYTDGTSLFSSTTKMAYTLGNNFVSGNEPFTGVVNDDMAIFANKAGIIGGVSYWDSSTKGGMYLKTMSFNSSSCLKSSDFVPMGICLTGDNSVYAQTDSFDAWLYYNNSTFNYSKFTADGHQKTALTSSPDISYAYYIDQDKNQLVTLYFKSESSEPEVLDRYDLTIADPDCLAVSESGANIVVYNGSDPSEVEVVRISQTE